MAEKKMQLSGEDATFGSDLERTEECTETRACDSPLSDVEYYQLVLTHRDGHDSNIELPITAKAIVNHPSFMQKFSCDEREAMIDELYRKLKETWMLTRRNDERD